MLKKKNHHPALPWLSKKSESKIPHNREISQKRISEQFSGYFSKGKKGKKWNSGGKALVISLTFKKKRKT